MQPSALIRFANALGFAGFSEMQQAVPRRTWSSARRTLPRAHRAACARGKRRRDDAAGACCTGFVADSIARARAARGARRARPTCAPRCSCSPARSASTCWRSGARSRSPATSPTRSASSSCARSCSTASAACSREFARTIGRRRRAARRRASATTRPRWSRPRTACHARGVPVIAITDSAAVAAEAAPPTCAFELGRRLEPAVPLAGRAAVPGAGAGGQRRPPARRAGTAARRARPRARRGRGSDDASASTSICIGRAAVDLYGEQIGGRLEDMRDASPSTSAARRPTPRSACARLGLQAGDAHARRRRAQRPLRARDAGRRGRRRQPRRAPTRSGSPRWSSSASATATPSRSSSTATTAPTWRSGAGRLRRGASSPRRRRCCVSGTHLSQPSTLRRLPHARCAARARPARASCSTSTTARCCGA